MKNKLIIIASVVSILISAPLFASDGLPAGFVKDLSYRGGWVMFKVVNDAGVNQCEQCPVDPGSMGTKRCWVKETKSAQISMILSAQARNKKIHGRVGSFNSACEVYQMTVDD